MQNSILLENITRDELRSELRAIVSELLDAKLRPEAPKDNITMKEAAAKLRISLPTVKRLIKEGTLPSYKIGQRILLKSDEVDTAVKRIESRKYKR
jgi:excisionase family DNA binding protein